MLGDRAWTILARSRTRMEQILHLRAYRRRFTGIGINFKDTRSWFSIAIGGKAAVISVKGRLLRLTVRRGQGIDLLQCDNVGRAGQCVPWR